MRFSTLLVLVFLATVATPAMLLVCDVAAITLQASVRWFRALSFGVLIGLVDTLFKVDSMIRRNIAMGEG